MINGLVRYGILGGGAGYSLPASLVHEYLFDNNVLDTVGSNDGTASNITYSNDAYGNWAVFNGTTSKISFTELLTTTQLDNDFAVEIVLLPDDGTSNEQILDFYGQRNIRTSLGETSQKLKFNFYDGGPNLIESTTNISTVNPTHAIFNRSKTNGIELFVNSVSEDSDAFTGNANSRSDTTQMGAEASSFYFDGKLLLVRLYTSELTQDQIDGLYNGGNFR